MLLKILYLFKLSVITMTVADANQYLNPLAFVSLGTVLGAMLNKVFAVKDKNNLYWIFYGFSMLCFLYLGITWFATSGAALNGAWYLTLVCNVALILITRFILTTKNIYKTAELDTVINAFTGKADKNFINLLCGDINFFGAGPDEMDKNIQYTYLKSSGFREINILCYPPVNNSDRMRYGKLLRDMPAVRLRYYQPSEANVSLRGRITRFQGGDKLMMYFKISSNTYQAIETDTANSNGALYRNIWELIWNLGQVPPIADLDRFIELSRS